MTVSRLAAGRTGAHFRPMEIPRFLSGKLLLAMPGIGIRGLLEQLGIEPGEAPDGPVLHGGPVEPGRGFVLHSDDWGGQDTIQVAGIGALTGTIDVLKAIAEGRGPSRYLVALGYAGWGEGQLDEEMGRPGWFTTDGSEALLFATPTEARWEASFKAEGIDPRLLDSAAGSA